MISIKGLTMRFGDRTVLEQIDLDVAKQEIVAVMGSSGGGKTTLLRCIAGLIDATEGDVHVDDVDVKEDPETARCRMGMVFQSAALFDFMTVEQNVRFGVERRMRVSRKEVRDRVHQALDRVGLVADAHKLPSELSGGMRKRVGMARAVVLQPKVMLYDEPTTGLDPVTTYTIDELMVMLRDTLQMTSVIVSHDVNSVLRTSDRVAFLHQGKTVYLGPTDEFLKSDHPAIREIVRKSQATSLNGS